MSKETTNNYEAIIQHFKLGLNKANTVPCDSLKDFVMKNTKDFVFSKYSPKTDKALENLEYINTSSKERYNLFLEPGLDAIRFSPRNYDDLLLDIISSKTKIFLLKINDMLCRKEQLDKNGFSQETYNLAKERINTKIYTYEDTVDAYNKCKSSGDLLKVSSATFSYPFFKYNIKPTYYIEAYIDSNFDVVITKYNKKKDILIDEVKTHLEPGLKLYDVYNNYLNKFLTSRIWSAYDGDYISFDRKEEMFKELERIRRVLEDAHDKESEFTRLIMKHIHARELKRMKSTLFESLSESSSLPDIILRDEHSHDMKRK